jgi:hypothetical protein
MHPGAKYATWHKFACRSKLERPQYSYHLSGLQAKFSYYHREFNQVFPDAPATQDALAGG